MKHLVRDGFVEPPRKYRVAAKVSKDEDGQYWIVDGKKIHRPVSIRGESRIGAAIRLVSKGKGNVTWVPKKKQHERKSYWNPKRYADLRSKGRTVKEARNLSRRRET